MFIRTLVLSCIFIAIRTHATTKTESNAWHGSYKTAYYSVHEEEGIIIGIVGCEEKDTNSNVGCE